MHLGVQCMTIPTTFSNGCLGSHNDDERSEMRYVMRIAKLRESLKFWTHIAPSGNAWGHTYLSVYIPHSSQWCMSCMFAGDGLWFWTLRKRPSLLECIWQVGTCLPVDRPACSGERYFMYWLLEIVRQIGQRGMRIRKPNFPNDVVVKGHVVWKGRRYVGMIWHVLFCACWVWLVYLWAL